jgi:hypothetical protein
VIVSTNIAETGLTIPGIKYVVDSGLQKERSVITSASGSEFCALFGHQYPQANPLAFLQACPHCRPYSAASRQRTKEQVERDER